MHDMNVDLLSLHTHIHTYSEKEAFYRTCDAMLHARRDGETFGLAVAEFSVRNKPVITKGASKRWVASLHYRAIAGLACSIVYVYILFSIPYHYHNYLKH